MIQPYKIFFHPNYKIRPPNTKPCVGTYVAYTPKLCIYHYYHGISIFEKTQGKICNAQNIRSGEMANCLFETYEIYVMPYGKHMFQIASDMANATMCAYPSSNYYLTHWKCVLYCFAQRKRIDLPSPESD